MLSGRCLRLPQSTQTSITAKTRIAGGLNAFKAALTPSFVAA